MEFEVLNEIDARLTAFLLGRHSESFLLNALPSGDDPQRLRIAAIDSGAVVGVASVSNGGLTLQAEQSDQSNLLSAALSFSRAANLKINRVSCSAGATSSVIQGVEASIGSVLSTETAVLFERQLNDSLSVPLPLSARQACASDQELIARAIREELQLPTEAVPSATAMAAYRCASNYWILKDHANEVLSLGGISEQEGATVKVFGVLTPAAHRGQGLAPLLIEHFLAVAARDAGARYAVLLARNEPACRCYERMGFAEIGRFVTLENG